MINSSELYDKIVKRQQYVSAWYDEIVINTLTTIKRQGFIDPRCYVLYFIFGTEEYTTTIIDLEPDSLYNPDNNQNTYLFLRALEKSVGGTIVGMAFISEGSKPTGEEGDRQGFLLLSFEDKVNGFKSIYKLQKKHEISADGPTLRLESMDFDEQQTKKRGIPQIEKFTHILRNNYFDQESLDIYN